MFGIVAKLQCSDYVAGTLHNTAESNYLMINLEGISL